MLLLSTTAWAVCGDRILDNPIELCDDGNLDDGDGCDSVCRVEDGWKCNQDPVTVVTDQGFDDDWGLAEPAWFFSSDKRTVTQLLDAAPSAYTTEVMVDEGSMEFTIRVDDASGTGFVGWTLGLEPNEARTDEASYLLFDWKGSGESEVCGYATEGLSVSLVNGPADTSDLWCHENTVSEIAGLGDLSDEGWDPQTTYDVIVDATSTRVTVSVDGLEVLDLEGNHPAGPLGFYAFSQEEATFELVVPDQLSVCREDGTVVGYTGGVCTGCSSSGGGIWAALLALAALRRRR
ncbi:MAG TPA: MYXO-CTERM sorting domain-containing protein [Myxococcota bacterium]|nr:MYXO-CTERM sorting domain-containing protein [Myxococcota bacterium]